MDLSNLKPAEGSVKSSKRVGRGEGTGKGGTATRGHKGAQSRSGYSRRAGFEGGQMPLQRRIPKFGFKNPTRKEYVGLNLDRLQNFVDKFNVTEITPEVLHQNKFMKKSEKVKVLGRGVLTSKITVKLHGFTPKAKQAIENAGGTVETI